MLIQALVFVCLGLQAQPLPKLVGTLSVTEGKVRFERAGRDPEWAGKYVRLRVGDKLTIVEKPRATLSLDATREVWRLPEKGAWEVQAKTVKSLDGQALLLVRRGAPLRQLPGKPPAKLAGEIRGDDTAISPIGAVTTTPIVISWNRAPGASKASLEILDSRGKKLWSKAGLTATSLPLPSDKTKVGAWLQVRVVQSGGGKATSTSTWVRLLPPAEKQALAAAERELREQLEPNSPALGLALGDLWASASLVSQLRQALVMVWPEYIARPRPEPEVVRAWHWKHGEWLESAGFVSLARKEYERAWEAGERDGELKATIERLGGKAEIEEWELVAANGRRLIAAGKNPDALGCFLSIVESKLKKPNTLETTELAMIWAQIGDLMLAKPDLDRADKALDVALFLLQGSADSTSLRVAEVLHKQAKVARARQSDRGLAIAQSKWEACLKIIQICEPDSLNAAIMLTNLGNVARARGDRSDAQRRYQEALYICEVISPASRVVAEIRETLGAIAWERRDLEEAKRRFGAAIDLWKSLSPNSLDLARTLCSLGNVENELGDRVRARNLYESSLALCENSFEPGVAASQMGLGLVAFREGDYDRAQQLFELALSTCEKLNNSVDKGANLCNLGDVALARNDPGEAQRRYESGLAVFHKVKHASVEVASAIHNLAVIAHERNDVDLARRRYQEALAMYQNCEPDSLLSAQCLFNFGLLEEGLDDLHEAKRRYEDALKVYRVRKPDSQEVAATMAKLAVVSQKMGVLDEAGQLYQDALAIFQRISPRSRDVAATKGNLGLFAMERGHLELAENLLEEAFSILSDLSPASPDIAVSLDNLRAVAMLRGDYQSLVENASRMLDLSVTLVTNHGQWGAGEISTIERRTASSLQSIGFLDDGQAFYTWLPTLRGAGFALQVRLKKAERVAIEDKLVKQAATDAAIAKKQVTDWIIKPRTLPDKAWSERLSDLDARKRSAEVRLATLLAKKDPRLAAEHKVSQSDVQNAIPEGTAIIEYLQVSSWDREAKKPGEDAYSAFVVQHDGDVRFIRLAPAQEIDDLVEEWQTQLALATDSGATNASLVETQKELKTVGAKLYDKLIKPLGKLPPNLLIAPDDRLHALPFTALVDARGKFLVETTSISIVGSGRDLVEKPITGEPGSAAVIAGPDFGADAKTVQDANVKTVDQTMRALNAKGEWDPLPSAGVEGEAIAKLMGTEPISGSRATEERLLSLERPRVLHIATHGFFIPPVSDREDRENRLMMDIGRGIRVADNPMLRSGLILAGANKDEELRKAGLADGWATALEISQMDLRGTELVVLSACETGRGDVKGAEGVFGLQRAFRFAGAQTLVMSLFKVPDDSTRILMENFYKTWKPGAPAGSKQKALRDAQLTMLKNPKTRHPRNWAGFVLMGER